MLDPTNALPLWAQLRDALRQRIVREEWTPGSMLPSELELCEYYGVSRITTARALQELVREGLLQRQRGRGTVVTTPSRRACGPAALAYVTARLDFEWTLTIYSGFEAVAAEARHFALLASTGGRPTLDATRVEQLLAEHARGLAISHLHLSDDVKALLPALRRQHVPLAFVGTYDPTVECDRVVADNERAGRLAVEHLQRLGHRRIAFLGPGEVAMAANTALQGRLAGYRAAIASLAAATDRPARPAVIEGDPRDDPRDGRRDEDLALLDTLPAALDDAGREAHLLAFLDRTEATAAVAATDALAALVVRHLRPAGLSVPDHLALVGISDDRVAALLDVPLTTVRIDARALGAETARLLLRRLEGDRSPPQHIVLPVELVVRASCGVQIARMHHQAEQPSAPLVPLGAGADA